MSEKKKVRLLSKQKARDVLVSKDFYLFSMNFTVVNFNSSFQFNLISELAFSMGYKTCALAKGSAFL